MFAVVAFAETAATVAAGTVVAAQWCQDNLPQWLASIGGPTR